ncbi:MAG: DUF1244 domain-containing protein [Rhodobacteraceae bacterium]|jgi:hypothetical protein|nr:DUF1244 domain-containing protein [Paracoccaceae bacterium]
MNEPMRTEIEAATFRRLVLHLMEERPDVQNIELMTLAGFCRNCLARWYDEEAAARGQAIGKAAAREIVYGMPYEAWVARHQRPATPGQEAAFAAAEASAKG